MRVSKYIKAHKDILVEYIYDDGNNVSEGYKILINSRENTYSFVSPKETSSSNNTDNNQLFPLDRITNYWGIVNTQNYSFLQYKDFPPGFPIRFDTIKVHLPINYTFGEYLGCYVRVYAFDTNNKKEYNLSNFYYDQSDVELSDMVDFTSPPIKFQEKLWGKALIIDVPSVYYVSRQMSGSAPKVNTVNANLTNGAGLNQDSPIFIDFSFIEKKTTISGIVSYYLTSPKKMSLPQTPDYENLGVKIEHSKNGDFFEIYGIFNGNINEFKRFIENSRLSNKSFYVEYEVTLFEQNIRGKTLRFTVTQNYNEKIEYRPIIKYTTTTAVIDVEMKVIDAVDDSIIYRRASYGMLQDEVGKYSLNLTKINLLNANKPKIYSIKTPLIGGGRGNELPTNTVFLEPISIDRTVLVDKFNLVAKSDSVVVGKNIFYGKGKLKILLQPFDNIILFIIAKDVSTEQTPGINNLGNLAFVKAPQYLDMSNMGEINLIIKNDSLKFETGLYVSSQSIDLTRGQVVFRIPESSMREIRQIYDSGQNVFYITSKLNSVTTSIYEGLFDLFNTQQNINTINLQQVEVEREVLSAEKTDVLIDNYSQNTAIVFRRKVTQISGTQSLPITITGVSNSSIPATTKIDGTTYTITNNSSLTIDGYEWTSSQIKESLNLSNNPITLSIRTDSLFADTAYLDGLLSLSQKLVNKYLTTEEDKTRYKQTQDNFKNTNS